MARPRVLTAEQRAANKKASNLAWRERNAESVRAKEAAYRARPGNAERKRTYHRALYQAQRQALLDAGFEPRPVGRPRLHTPEEAAELHRIATREHMRKLRARLKADAERPVRSSEEIGQ